MKKITRILIIAASIALIICFFTPLWVITLDAPQYPEGLGLYIWVDKITGDLQTINGLNHYIGMKTIEPDSIKELTLMPYFLGFLIAFGVLTGILGKKKILVAWTLIFIVLGIAGGIDFYIWEYDYGHNLSEDAAIKVPGMTYQPPLIGSKELLNFTAASYPDTGGQVLIASGFIALLLTIFELKRKQRSGKNEKKLAIPLLLTALLWMSSCTADPEPINFGTDQCDHCRMMIMDSKFGAEIVSSKGKVFKFDAAECMVNFIRAGRISSADERSYYVIDASKPATLTDATTAFYLISEHFPSPMGANLSAYAGRNDAESFRNKYPGEILEWNQLLEKFK